jgi:hypothetical protein
MFGGMSGGADALVAGRGHPSARNGPGPSRIQTQANGSSLEILPCFLHPFERE